MVKLQSLSRHTALEFCTQLYIGGLPSHTQVQHTDKILFQKVPLAHQTPRSQVMSTEAPDPIENIGSELLATAISLTTLALIVVFARVYSRAVLLGTFGSDDYALIIAMMMGLVMAVLSIVNVCRGLGMVWRAKLQAFSEIWAETACLSI